MRRPQIGTLPGVRRSNYFRKNHATHTSIMTGRQDRWPWQLPLSDSPKRTGGRVRNNLTNWRVLPWRRREKQRQGSRGCVSGILSVILELHFHQSSLFICWIVTSSSLCESRFYSRSANEICSGKMEVNTHWAHTTKKQGSSRLTMVSFSLLQILIKSQ